MKVTMIWSLYSALTDGSNFEVPSSSDTATNQRNLGEHTWLVNQNMMAQSICKFSLHRG